ncbi:MAG: superinfection immunity protein [Ruminococcaceae bacterium]|nr:superinfection immunity protein [Oscillospiraceae bacterium]
MFYFGGGFSELTGYIFVLAAFFVYMLPFFISLFRKNFKVKTLLFNFFLGWTIVMWIMCMVWACRKDEPETPAVTTGYVPVTPAENTYVPGNAHTPVASTANYTPVADTYPSQNANKPASNEQNAASVRFCPVCGTPHKEGYKFCGNCGKQF